MLQVIKHWEKGKAGNKATSLGAFSSPPDKNLMIK